MTEELKEQLDRIERLTLLSAKNVLTLDDVSLLTGLSKSHLYKLTCSHQIPYYKQAKLLYFDRTEIEAWMRQNRISTNDEIESEAVNYLVTGKLKNDLPCRK